MFAYMLADDAERYTSAALAEGLRVSPAAISGAVRHLTATRMVVKERQPGKRAELYRVCDGNVWGMVVAPGSRFSSSGSPRWRAPRSSSALPAVKATD
ncbi:MarR family transcriptional regulator [Amycolatopsis tucumanensis]|nr:helix-turn-helix domain-containing protein [Amycolatopsis tucumanensis]MCF6428450.1 MarR family transcriptional regulator [Amycolatopsis tucumanensis]